MITTPDYFINMCVSLSAQLSSTCWSSCCQMRPHCWPSTTSFIWPYWWATHTLTKHADRALTAQCTMEISFTGIYVCSCSKRRASQPCCVSGATHSPAVHTTQITHRSLNCFLFIRFQTRQKMPNRFGLFFFSDSWMNCSSNVCLLIQVVNLFNMFITYGDTFLPTSNSYDELYYEIVRMHQVFDNLYCMGTLVEAELQCLTWAEQKRLLWVPK